ncbi:MAG: acetyl/propionyl/methylcrotonyl-CoA carboxylase subunit alpha [Candidatus Tyrphobacter sp.]
MFRRILIANRGEIAVRVIRTAREMGIACVAVYSEADRDAMHVRMADESYLLGPAIPEQSYLDVDRLIEVARRACADAVHPGYGFLAENAHFARRVVAEGLTWIGPHPDAIDAMGDKLLARRAMETAGVPFVPGGVQPLADAAAARGAAERYGLPLALKASGGGGGKGLKVARTLDDIDAAFSTATREAQAYFKNPTVYAERYLENPKHVELQILADKHGTTLHVGERDCSLQRRHQKLWEEAPADVCESVRSGIRDAGLRAARAIAYDSVGTIEFLVDGDAFYFLEMNTRIQVEHTVTEMISGLDLVREQIRVAAGEPLGYAQDAVRFFGWAIEGRVNAEDPYEDFRPAPGTILVYREPGGPGVRVDSAAFAGLRITPEYDSLIAKLVVWAPSRSEAIARLRRAIGEYRIEGVPTTLPILRALCEHETVRDATYGTATLEAFAQTLRSQRAAAPYGETATPTFAMPASVHEEDGTIAVEVDDKLYRVRLPSLGRPAGLPKAPRVDTSTSTAKAATGNEIRSPMHGVVVEISVSQGEHVAVGQVVAVIEAMKMMNEIRAPRAGTVKAAHAAPGATVDSNAPLLTIE